MTRISMSGLNLARRAPYSARFACVSPVFRLCFVSVIDAFRITLHHFDNQISPLAMSAGAGVEPLQSLSLGASATAAAPAPSAVAAAPPAAPQASSSSAPAARPRSPSFKEKSATEKQEAMSVWSGFFKKTLRERQDQIQLVYPHLDLSALDQGGLPGTVADVMVRLFLPCSSGHCWLCLYSRVLSR